MAAISLSPTAWAKNDRLRHPPAAAAAEEAGGKKREKADRVGLRQDVIDEEDRAARGRAAQESPTTHVPMCPQVLWGRNHGRGKCYHFINRARVMPLPDGC